MSKTFDYQTATLEAVALRFQTITNQAFSRLLAYYTNKNDSAMVVKLQQARMLARIRKMQREYAEEYGV